MGCIGQWTTWLNLIVLEKDNFIFVVNTTMWLHSIGGAGTQGTTPKKLYLSFAQSTLPISWLYACVDLTQFCLKENFLFNFARFPVFFLYTASDSFSLVKKKCS